jgi:membrane dipeptidase
MEHLADHVDYIADLAGIDCIGLGFDFCDFLGDDTTASFRTEGPVQTTGLEDASKAYNFIDLLIRRGYKTCDLEKIAFKNFERVLKDILG